MSFSHCIFKKKIRVLIFSVYIPGAKYRPWIHNIFKLLLVNNAFIRNTIMLYLNKMYVLCSSFQIHATVATFSLAPSRTTHTKFIRIRYSFAKYSHFSGAFCTLYFCNKRINDSLKMQSTRTFCFGVFSELVSV